MRFYSKRYSVTTRPSGSASPVALPAIVWIGATLPLPVAAKPRIAFEPGLETNTSPLALLTASPKLKPFPPLSPVFEPEMVRIGATLPCRSGGELADRSSRSIEDVDVERSVLPDRATRAGSYQPGVAAADLRLHGGGSRRKDIDRCRLGIRHVEKVVAVDGQTALVGDGTLWFNAAVCSRREYLDGAAALW